MRPSGCCSCPCRPPRKPSVLAQIARIGHLLAFVVIANRRHTDLFEWAQRSTVFSLPAEIQRRLLPAAFTCEAGAFTLSAWLEPAASVGGDTFDYCLGRDVLHLSLTDAMGHGVASALTATLCVGSLRNTRRQGGSHLDQAAAANLAVFEHAAASGAEHFATGMLGRLDLNSGVLAMVNAGHVAPYLCRDGTTAAVDLPVDVPLGLFGDTSYRSTDIALHPGDRLVMVTDGMLERDAAGLDLVTAINQTRTLHPREATRGLTDLVVQALRRGPGRRCHPHGPGLARRAREPPADDRGCRAMAHQPDRPPAGPSRYLRALRSDRWVRAAGPCAGTPAPVRGR